MRRLARLGEGEELLELVDEEQQAPPSRVRLAQRLPEPGWPARERGDELRLPASEHGRERGGQGLERAVTGPQREGDLLTALVQGARGHAGQHARAAQRRLAGPGVSGHEDQGSGAEALQHGADVCLASEEERPVLGLEGLQAPVGIADAQRRGCAEALEPLQGLAEGLGRDEALQWIGREAPGDERGEVRVDIRPERGARGRLRPGRRATGDLARAQLVEDEAQGVDVASRRRRSTREQLGRHVGHRAGDEARARRRGRFRLEALGQAEVEQLHLPFPGDQGVGGFEVAVEHALAMRRREPAGQADAQGKDAAPRHRQGQFREALADDVLGDDVRAAVHLSHAEDIDDVGVLHAREGPGLGREVLTDPGVGLARGHELHRHAPIQRGVVRQEDDAHAPTADGPFEAELVKRVGRCPGQPRLPRGGIRLGGCRDCVPRVLDSGRKGDQEGPAFIAPGRVPMDAAKLLVRQPALQEVYQDLVRQAAGGGRTHGVGSVHVGDG